MLKGSSLLSLEFALISPLEIEDGDQDVVESTWSDIIRVCNKTAESVIFNMSYGNQILFMLFK